MIMQDRIQGEVGKGSVSGCLQSLGRYLRAPSPRYLERFSNCKSPIGEHDLISMHYS